MATLDARLTALETVMGEQPPTLLIARYDMADDTVIGIGELWGDVTHRLPGETVEALTARAPPAPVRRLLYAD